MNIDSSVKVKEGIVCPDNENYNIGGWQGRVIDIEENSIEIEWDSVTLQQMPVDYIVESFDNDLDYSSMVLYTDEVEETQPRDKKVDVLKMQEKLDKQFGGSEIDEIETRVLDILDTEDPLVNGENLEMYREYLIKNIDKYCILTGIEDFSWEEPYVLGGWDRREYEELKKVNPSYTDHFQFIEFDEEVDERIGLTVKVKRVSDGKLFSLPLCDLEAVDENSENYQLVADYSFWQTNY